MTDIGRLVAALSEPSAYPHAAGDLEVHHTHISVVFLAGPYAYKVKKPLDLGFLDFTTLEKRRHFCLEEVRLNARLAPGVYLGVVPVVERDGRLRIAAPARGGVEDEGRLRSEAPAAGPEAAQAAQTGVIEYAVWMERLPDEATLEARLPKGEVSAALLEGLARRIAAFHASAAGGERVAACGRWEVVAGNCRENFEQAEPQIGITLSAPVYRRARELAEVALERLRPLVEQRAAAGVPRDTHGDLRLDHVYVFPERAPPGDLVVVDCIEFNERFRYADPVSDVAFLVMDLVSAGRRDLAEAFAEAYATASGDDEGRALRPFYVAYRAAVRGKVEGFEALSEQVPEPERDEALRASRAHWLLALGELEQPGRRPCVVLIGGLPGTGKSTLARGLAAGSGFEVLASDHVRKELAGLAPEEPAGTPFGGGLYTPGWNDRVYTELARRAVALLFDGRRVIVDASFREEGRRRAFLELAREWGVPGVLLLCRAKPEVVRRRLAARSGDASDADWEIYRRAAEAWDELGARTRRHAVQVPTVAGAEAALDAALEALRARGLA